MAMRLREYNTKSMRNILYWSFLILLAILLAYASPFGLYHVLFLAGAGVAFLLWRFTRAHHSKVQLLGTMFVYVAVYWTTIGLFSNVKVQREFLARYEPYLHQGSAEGFTFQYVDYPQSYERIDSPELNKLLAEKHPQQVRMIVETVWDFGRLRAYTVRSVEGIPVDQEWTSGNPPWEALRQRK
jgi:hypothetical protein